MSNEFNVQSRLEDQQDETSLRYMLKLAFPIIITNISFTIMQFVDRLMVSKLGTDELAAILPAGFVSFVPGSFAIGVISSVTTFVSQSLGRGQRRSCSSYFWQSVYMGLIFFILVIAVMWPFAEHFFRFLGSEPSVIEKEVIYFRIMLYSQLVAVFIWSSSQFFMGIHRPVINMYAALSGQVVNISCNYVLIFGKFGFPAMGIAGAGWGTFIGIVAGSLIRMGLMLHPSINDRFYSRSTLGLDFRKMKDLLKIGLPAGFEMMINISLWSLVMFWLVGRFGKEATAATSAVFSCTSVAVMPIVGLKISLAAAVGKSIGAEMKEAAIKQTNLCLKIALAYMGFIGICFLVFRNGIMHVWSDDAGVIGIGVEILIWAAILQIFQAVRIVYSGSLRGAGDTVWLALVSGIIAIVILLLGGYVLVKFLPGLNAVGPWIAATMSICAVGIASWLRFRSNKWMQIDLFKYSTAELARENEAGIE